MIKLGTKAETLQQLYGKLKFSKVLTCHILYYSEWVDDRTGSLNTIQNVFSGTNNIIIRSSSSSEDTLNNSNAGKYTTVPNISLNDSKGIINSVNKVFSSYGEDISESSHLLIQPQLQNLKYSGVIFTKDQITSAPYYIINYDDKSGNFDTVTSGSTNDLKTFIAHRNYLPDSLTEPIFSFLQAVKEIELLINSDALDIEIAMDESGEVTIFQVRHLITTDISKTIYIDEYLNKIKKKIEKLNLPHPNLYGTKTILGIMPDWNPAEIVGTHPRKLALSLYKELITDSIWAYQRNNYGYKNLRSFPLLISLMGQPFVDVRVSFNSFIPNSINDDLSHRLANYYLDRLTESPHFHDKVEFEIVFSCFYLDLPNQLEKLKDYDFSESDVRSLSTALLDLTNNIISPNNGLYLEDIKKVHSLDKRRESVLNSKMSLIDKIYWLVEECKRYGTLPFAGLARAAFIGIQFLKSFVNLEIITQTEYNHFLSSLHTIAKQINTDYYKLSNRKISIEEFKSKYGHLRPGTYDILSERYDKAFDKYFNLTSTSSINESAEFNFSKDQLAIISKHLIESKVKVTAIELVEFIKIAIEAREYSKFIFTKCISDILELIEELSSTLNISIEDSAHLDITQILSLYSNLDQRDLINVFLDNISINKELYEIGLKIKLPHLIVNSNEIFGFYLGDDEPNFITQKKILAPVCNSLTKELEYIEDSIVFIESADPGFDWIFSKKIAGLVTMYGGANSHMAIRCAELSIPAIIGCGEKKYTQWSKSKRLEINCANKTVIEIQ